VTRIDAPPDFHARHIGPDEADVAAMLETVGRDSLADLIDDVVPRSIRLGRDLELPEALTEPALLAHLRRIADRNQVFRSFLGMGYHDTHTPGRDPPERAREPRAWYTQYTPYQAEIAQGRLEALLNFQTMVRGPDRARDRQRLAARRGHGGGRGHDTCCTQARRRATASVFLVAETATRRPSRW
jgi:glycine dehydrogenase